MSSASTLPSASSRKRRLADSENKDSDDVVVVGEKLANVNAMDEKADGAHDADDTDDVIVLGSRLAARHKQRCVRYAHSGDGKRQVDRDRPQMARTRSLDALAEAAIQSMVSATSSSKATPFSAAGVSSSFKAASSSAAGATSSSQAASTSVVGATSSFVSAASISTAAMSTDSNHDGASTPRLAPSDPQMSPASMSQALETRRQQEAKGTPLLELVQAAKDLRSPTEPVAGSAEEAGGSPLAALGTLLVPQVHGSVGDKLVATSASIQVGSMSLVVPVAMHRRRSALGGSRRENPANTRVPWLNGRSGSWLIVVVIVAG